MVYVSCMLYSQNDVAKLGSILGIWAHPDDECWASAGLMKMASLNGQKIGIITATNGDAGETADESKWPKEKLGEIREKELTQCLCNVGKVEQFWLDYKDGELISTDDVQAIEKIVGIINLFNPDTVITFEPNGITGHDDHRTINIWANEAVVKSSRKIEVLEAIESVEKFEHAGRDLDGQFNIFFNVKEPNLVTEDEVDVLIKLPEDLLECKLMCLKAHASQTAHIFDDNKGNTALEAFVRTECFITHK